VGIPIGLQQELINRIVDRVGGTMKPCPMCGKTEFFLAHQIFMIETTDTLQQNLENVFSRFPDVKSVAPTWV
jgi:hypothetical protein